MNGILVEMLVCVTETVLQVLVHVLGDERSDARHQDRSGKENLVQDVKGLLLLLDAFFTLHSGPVKSDIPVGELIEEREEWLHNVVETVGVHFSSHKLDHMLSGRDDPSVHKVAGGIEG